MPTEQTRATFGSLNPWEPTQERFMNLRCVIYNSEEDNYWLGPLEGTTPNQHEAHTYLVRDAVNHVVNEDRGSIMLHLLELAPLMEAPFQMMPYQQTYPPLTVEQVVRTGLDQWQQPDDVEFTIEGRVMNRQGDFTALHGFRRCRVRQANRQPAAYWDQQLAGYVPVTLAGVWIVSELLARHPISSPGTMLEILKEAPLPEGKKCLFEGLIPPGLIGLLKAAPGNPQVRTQVHARILVPLPDELTAYEQIVEWVEANIDWTKLRRLSQQQAAQQGANVNLEAIFEAVLPPDPPSAFNVDVRCTDAEVGSCNWTTTRSGSTEVTVTAEEIDHALTDAPNIGAVVDRLAAAVREESWEQVEMEDDDGGTSYDGYETNETTDHSARVNREHLRTQLTNWLRANQPDELARLQAGEQQ